MASAMIIHINILFPMISSIINNNLGVSQQAGIIGGLTHHAEIPVAVR